MNQSTFCSFLFLILITVFSTQALTNNELLDLAKKNSKPNSFGYVANFSSKTSIQNQSVNDSGLFYYTPPNKSRVDFFMSNIVMSSCGDTTWLKAANGDVTRSITPQTSVTTHQASASTFNTPSLYSLLKSNTFKIQRTDSSTIVVTMNKMNGTENIPITLYIDRASIMLQRLEFPLPMAGTLQIGYRYKLFSGQPVLEEMNSVMGTMGFSRIRFFNYKKCRKNSSFFRSF